jgi:hypothetical protein
MKASRHPLLVFGLALLWPVAIWFGLIFLVIYAMNNVSTDLKKNGGLKHQLEELWNGDQPATSHP